MISAIVNIFLFIIIFGFLTLIHELGHFLVAKLIKAKVYEFSLGFGPKLLSKEYKETEYCIRAIPLGGFVKILGDGDPGKEVVEKDLSKSNENLKNKPKILQVAVMLAGVTMNVLFAVIFYYIILGMSDWKTQPMYVDLEGVNVVGVGIEGTLEYKLAEEGFARDASIPEEGIIQKVDGQKVESREGLVDLLGDKEQVSMSVCDLDNVCNVFEVGVDEEGKVGIIVFPRYVLNYSNNKVFAGPLYLVNNLKIIGNVLGGMIDVAQETGDYSDISNTVAGPVGIFILIDNFKAMGFVVLLSLVADLSISLAIMNLLPIPALDGGRVMILFIEAVLRKDLNEKVEAIIINGSMIFLILLIIAIFIKDIVNIDNMIEMFG